jgi:hypothetical protein
VVDIPYGARQDEEDEEDPELDDFDFIDDFASDHDHDNDHDPSSDGGSPRRRGKRTQGKDKENLRVVTARAVQGREIGATHPVRPGGVGGWVP